MSDEQETPAEGHRFSRAPLSPLGELQQENDFLTAEIAKLQARMPTDEELAWLRNRKREEESAAWAWQQIRKHAPWVLTVATVIGTGIAYLAGHNVHVSPK